MKLLGPDLHTTVILGLTLDQLQRGPTDQMLTGIQLEHNTAQQPECIECAPGTHLPLEFHLRKSWWELGDCPGMETEAQ